ncbi:DUF262 domain-containing HNH endonuclease family protein [Endozoicomonas gorgoniicola]|uniref:DUF262 domain-containing HNH endonuclease family protein n=1 Tax=Endozoicomonas gorgoniicola TaxID=1234144 RepID=A0ABT3N0D7_9GAMM|nr:DUF262 domain-containing HNH endonuclease family protein [Endozoicomonas gorgoniicola]MCW7555092.1 DUF262 domain-containing HNH endonuclease family protein [Endozoicomonas gorgoniicola]
MSRNQYEDIEELSVAKLFCSHKYVIPIYQRNYAWSEPEVEQLIQDVMDVALQNSESDYYLGSLVTYRRDNGLFETIDGQQRHTTLSILLSVLKNEFKQDLGDIDHINLGFDSRPKSDQTLRKLFSNPKRRGDEPEERTIRSAYEVAYRFLSREKSSVKAFTRYLLNRVKILRVVVPADTDLNHYFEIMNNQGEQLEKHEVLKARMMEKLGSNDERTAFAKIWDACADMNRYVQLGIDAGVREAVFGKNWNVMPEEFSDLTEVFANPDENTETQTLADIIATPVFKSYRSESKTEESGTFSSVVTFPNFLLHVLRVLTKNDVPLDDKRLLDTFDQFMPGEEDDPQWFIIGLLKARLLFDCYIIKRENEEDWSLKSLKLYTRRQKSFGYVNSDNDEKLNQQLTMLLSMFHVSFPAQVYKHWFNAALNYLYITCENSECWTIDGKGYLEFLEGLNDTFFYGRYGVFSGGEPIDYYDLTYNDHKVPEEFDVSHLDQATNVQNFIFNRLDYLLWKRLKAGETFKNVNMDYVNKRLNGFSFTFRTSVEHYFPQHPLGAEPMGNVDRFGNLCLISRSNNSKLSNYLPTAKKEHYEKATAVESLKQVFMMSYEDWGSKSQSMIEEHEEMMVEVLCNAS